MRAFDPAIDQGSPEPRPPIAVNDLSEPRPLPPAIKFVGGIQVPMLRMIAAF